MPISWEPGAKSGFELELSGTSWSSSRASTGAVVSSVEGQTIGFEEHLGHQSLTEPTGTP